ncbi:MAG: hypothetical protein ACI9S8_000790 [Chlamydiales bacterium]|jgi:hypothetical protein
MQQRQREVQSTSENQLFGHVVSVLKKTLSITKKPLTDKVKEQLSWWEGQAS